MAVSLIIVFEFFLAISFSMKNIINSMKKCSFLPFFCACINSIEIKHMWLIAALKQAS